MGKRSRVNPEDPEATNATTNATDSSSRCKKKLALSVTAIIVLAAVSIGVYFGVSGSPPSAPPSPPTRPAPSPPRSPSQGLPGHGCIASTSTNVWKGVADACEAVKGLDDSAIEQANSRAAFKPALDAFCAAGNPPTSDFRGSHPIAFSLASMVMDTCVSAGVWKPGSTNYTDAVQAHLAIKGNGFDSGLVPIIGLQNVKASLLCSVWKMYTDILVVGMTLPSMVLPGSAFQDPNFKFPLKLDLGGDSTWGESIWITYCEFVTGFMLEYDSKPKTLWHFVATHTDALCPYYFLLGEAGFKCCDATTCSLMSDGTNPVYSSSGGRRLQDYSAEELRSIDKKGELTKNLRRAVNMAIIFEYYFPEYTRRAMSETPTTLAYVPVLQLLDSIVGEKSLLMTAAIYLLKGTSKLGLLLTEHSRLVDEL